MAYFKKICIRISNWGKPGKPRNPQFLAGTETRYCRGNPRRRDRRDLWKWTYRTTPGGLQLFTRYAIQRQVLVSKATTEQRTICFLGEYSVVSIRHRTHMKNCWLRLRFNTLYQLQLKLGNWKTEITNWKGSHRRVWHLPSLPPHLFVMADSLPVEIQTG
jgi:hypothetical protein